MWEFQKYFVSDINASVHKGIYIIDYSWIKYYHISYLNLFIQKQQQQVTDMRFCHNEAIR